MLFVASSSKTDVNPMSAQPANGSVKSAGAGNNSVASAIQAYSNSQLYIILFAQFSPQSEATQKTNNPGINFIYRYAPVLPGGQPFVSVLDATPGDGMNPVWREVQIAFNKGFVPRQLYSDKSVLEAAARGEITLSYTNEVYYCPNAWGKTLITPKYLITNDFVITSACPWLPASNEGC